MQQKIKFNHHAAAVLPYYLNKERGLCFVLEQKGPDYMIPYFNNGLCLLGGNWQKGIHTEQSPEGTMIREVYEEFWNRAEEDDSLNDLIGEKVVKRQPELIDKYDKAAIQRIQQIGEMFVNGVRYAADYIVSINPPILENVLTAGFSIFARELSDNEFKGVENIIDEFDGKLTTDNLKWGGRTVCVYLDEINSENMKFTWSYDHMVNDMLGSELPAQEPKIIRTLGLVGAERIQLPQGIDISESGCPTYESFKKIGCEYKIHS